MELHDGDLSLTLAPTGAAIERLCFRGLPVAERGSIHGRFANRIAGADLPIGGKHYRLPANEGPNTLHGGPDGFSKRPWVLTQESENAALCRLVSPDGDQGFPGTLTVEVRYTLAENALRIAYRAGSDADTALNLTNHAYFNLNGLDGPLHGAHTLYIAAETVLETDAALIPTGRFTPVAGTRLDFRTPRPLSGSYDHCFVLSGAAPAATLRGTASGVALALSTSCPGVQLYTTDHRVCLEAQALPDAVHHPNFPSTILAAGDVFTGETVYRFFGD